MSTLQMIAMVILSLMGLASVRANVAVEASTRSADGFDYFMFVRYKFTIHGLWPNYNDGTWPQFCDPSYDFHHDNLGDIISDLLEQWPTYFNDNNQFWEHEWSKHGTCALKVLPSEHSYFATVLSLNTKYDIGAALNRANILPSDTKRYPHDDIVGAIEDAFGVSASLHCDNNGQLSEVWMCIGRDLKPMECPKVDRKQCQDVLIPHLPSSQKQLDHKENQDEEDSHHTLTEQVESTSIKGDGLVSSILSKGEGEDGGEEPSGEEEDGTDGEDDEEKEDDSGDDEPEEDDDDGDDDHGRHHHSHDSKGDDDVKHSHRRHNHRHRHRRDGPGDDDNEGDKTSGESGSGSPSGQGILGSHTSILQIAAIFGIVIVALAAIATPHVRHLRAVMMTASPTEEDRNDHHLNRKLQAAFGQVISAKAFAAGQEADSASEPLLPTLASKSG